MGCVAPLGEPEAFAAAIKTVADPILAGKLTPTDVQHAYACGFNRERVMEGYMRVFGLREADQREERIA